MPDPNADAGGGEALKPDVVAWAKTLLETAEKWPDDGPHLQPKQFVRGLVRQVEAEAMALRVACDALTAAEQTIERLTEDAKAARQERDHERRRAHRESEQAKQRERELREAISIWADETYDSDIAGRMRDFLERNPRALQTLGEDTND